MAQGLGHRQDEEATVDAHTSWAHWIGSNFCAIGQLTLNLISLGTFKRLARGRYTNANHNFTGILLYHDLGAGIVESSRKLFNHSPI